MNYYIIVIPVLISFVLSVLMGPVVIPFLRRLKMGQTERVEGVQSHLKKAGTPTMGGVMILISVLVTSLFYVKDYPKIIPVLFVTVGFGLIGFLDDYLKVVMKRSDGLFPMQKMALQIVVTAVFAFYLVKFTDVSLTMLIPVFRRKISGHWLACDPTAVYCGDWYCKWCEFHRRSGWSGIKCYSSCGDVFHGHCCWNKERTGAGYMCGCRSVAWILIV